MVNECDGCRHEAVYHYDMPMAEPYGLRFGICLVCESTVGVSDDCYKPVAPGVYAKEINDGISAGIVYQ